MVKNVIIIVLTCIIIFLSCKLQWTHCDINWIATLLGSIIMGVITWMAIFETSRQDRINRKFEYRNTFYNDKLIELYDCIGVIELLNDRAFNTQITTAFTVDDDTLNYITKNFTQFRKILNYITLLNPDSIFSKFEKEQMPSIKFFYDFLKDMLGKEVKEGECLNLFKHYLIDNEQLEKTDFTDKSDIIKHLKNEIRDKLKLEEK